MRNIFKITFLMSALAAMLWSCEKDETKDYFKGGTNPVLTLTVTDSVLVKDDANKLAATFEWTNPNYQFSTGISSQDVIYIIQVDTAGANFTNPNMQEISIPKELGTTMTVKDLNTVLSKLDVLENINHQIQFRIKANLNGSVVSNYSNVVTVNIVPYLDVAVPLPPTGKLYVTGDGTPSGWTNAPPESQICTQDNKVQYSIIMSLTPGFYYKFLSTQNQWQPQYGGSSKTGGDLGFNMGLPGQTDPAAIPTPDEAGTYKVVINFKTGKYTVTKQ